MKRIATFDLDSTLCDTEHRHHLIDRVNGTDWAAYSAACVDDELVHGVAALVHLAYQTMDEVHFVTGRMESSRAETVAWLMENLELSEDVTHNLHMDDTESGDHVTEFGSHAAYKVHRITELAKRLDAVVVFHVDDYPEVAAKLAEAGIPCVCVRPPFEVRSLTGTLA